MKSFRNSENATVLFVHVTMTALVGLMATAFVAESVPVLVVVTMAGTALLLWIGFRAFRHARLEVDPSGVRILNPFNDEFVPWDRLEGCTGGRFLTISTRTGQTFRVWGVQNPNWSHLRNQPGYADEVAGHVMELRARYDDS